MKGFTKDGKFRPTGNKSKSALSKKNFETGHDIKLAKGDYKKLNNAIKKWDKEHPDNKSHRFQIKRNEQSLDEGFQTESKLSGRLIGNDLSKNISTQFGRGTMSLGFFNVIDKYNKDHPDNQIDYDDSGLDGLDNTIVDFDDNEIYEDSMYKWKQWIEKPENQPIKEVISQMQLEVDNFNNVMDDKFENSDVFYRGTDMFEPDQYAMGSDIGSGENLDFASLTMNPQQARTTFNQGVVVEYYADEIKKMGSVNKTEYTMDFVPVLAIDHDSGQNDLETTDSKQNALFVDEQEVRVDAFETLEPNYIKTISYYPEKIGYENFISRIDEKGERNLIERFRNRGEDVTERVWALTHSKDIEDAVRKRLEFFSENTENKNFAEGIDIHIDFEHRFS